MSKSCHCNQIHISPVFLQQAKAQKKQMETKNQHVGRDSNIKLSLATTATMQSSTTHPKTDFTSTTPTTKASSAMRETSQQISKHQSTSDKKREPARGKGISLPLLVNAQDSNESTEPSLRSIKPVDSNVLCSQSTGKPLRERQLLPLPHLGEIIPPPVEFSEPSGKRKKKQF